MAQDEVNGGERQESFGIGRRKVLAGLATGLGLPLAPGVAAAEPADGPVNLAKVAKAHGGFVSGDTSYAALNNSAEPSSSVDASHGAYGTWPQTGRQWVLYEWEQPVSTDSVDLYWWQDAQGIALPTSAQLSFWDGKAFVPVRNARGGGVAGDRFNRTTFDRITTRKLKLEFVGDGQKSVGMLQWKVYNAGPVAAFAPVVGAGVDRAEKGYAVITREWREGDKVELELPMAVQRVTADERVEATRGKVALRYGPLVYNFERADQRRIDLPIGTDPLLPEWRGDLLGGVVAIRGRWADGSPLTAIPNYARMNRTGWAIPEFPGRSGVEYAPGSVGAGGAQQAVAQERRREPGTQSLVWITQSRKGQA